MQRRVSEEKSGMHFAVESKNNSGVEFTQFIYTCFSVDYEIPIEIENETEIDWTRLRSSCKMNGDKCSTHWPSKWALFLARSHNKKKKCLTIHWKKLDNKSKPSAEEYFTHCPPIDPNPLDPLNFHSFSFKFIKFTKFDIELYSEIRFLIFPSLLVIVSWNHCARWRKVN